MPGQSVLASLGKGRKRKHPQGKVASKTPPPLADDDEEEVYVEEEDVSFFTRNSKAAGFLASLDQEQIERSPGHRAGEGAQGELSKKEIKRQKRAAAAAADVADGDLESNYENKTRTTRSASGVGSMGGLSVDPVDALPVKTLEGDLVYRRLQAADKGREFSSLQERRALLRAKGMAREGLRNEPMEEGGDEEEGADDAGEGEESQTQSKKMTKEERKRQKELRRKAKQEGKAGEVGIAAEAQRKQDLRELEDELSMDDVREKLKTRMAEVGTTLMADPETHVGMLKELQDMCLHTDEEVSSLAMLSLVAVFKDILPGYRIRLPTEKELAMPATKEVRRLRDYEAALLRSYQAFVQMLVRGAKLAIKRHVALRCICALLAAVPHFNFRDSLLGAVIPRMDSADDACCSMCCRAVEEVFAAEGKHGGEATVEACQLTSDLVRQRACIVRPQVVEVFLKLQFDEDLAHSADASAAAAAHGGRGSPSDANGDARSRTMKSKRERKAEKRKLASKVHKEVARDFKEAEAVPDPAERRRLQTLSLAAVFETFFRVLKHSLLPPTGRVADGSGASAYGPRPLLRVCLQGLAKFSHLISIEFMADLLAVLRQLAKGGAPETEEEETVSLTVEERLGCCQVAFRIVRSNLDALSIDLRDFYVQLYQLLLDVPLVTGGEAVLAEALQVMLWEGRHADLARCGAFVKRLAASALHLDSARAMAVLSVVRQLLQRHTKCRNLLENDGGGGSQGGMVAVYRPDATDPDLAGALSSVLWELPLLAIHYHPAVAKLAGEVAKLATASATSAAAQMPLTPAAAIAKYSTARGGFSPSVSAKPPGGNKKGRGVIDMMSHDFAALVEEGATFLETTTEHRVPDVNTAFGRLFREARDYKLNRKLRRELKRVVAMSEAIELKTKEDEEAAEKLRRDAEEAAREEQSKEVKRKVVTREAKDNPAPILPPDKVVTALRGRVKAGKGKKLGG